MNDFSLERVKAIPPRPRVSMDTSRVTMVTSAIRSSCMEATMHMLRMMNPVADPTTYPNVARAMLMVANSTPLRHICVGISPYGNGILPTFATAMSYSPTRCYGCTPSVQVMSQFMSICAVMINTSYARKSKNKVPDNILERDTYTPKFAMMLRTSYACLSAGVAFVNCCPMIVSNDSRKIRCSSIFAEWMGNMIMIHSKYDRKLSIVSLGADADETMKDVFKSFKDTGRRVSYMRTVNPALLQRMNIKRTVTESPISPVITSGERLIDMRMGINDDSSAVAMFQWNMYTNETLMRFESVRALMSLTRQLVGHAPEDLLSQFLNTIENLHRNMESNALETMLSNMGVNETDNGTQQMGEFDAATTNAAPAVSSYVPLNPFASPGEIPGQAGGPVGDGSGDANPFVVSRDGRNDYTGPPMVGKRSQIGTMIDPTGKVVSQQVIIIESMLKGVEDTTTGYKEMQRDLTEVVKRQAVVISSLNKHGVLTDDDASAKTEFLEEFEQFCEKMMAKMETAYGTFAALPHVIEGERGIYEQESQPVAPLMRRADGTTMRENVYAPMVESARRGGQSIVDQRMGEGSMNPFVPAQSPGQFGAPVRSRDPFEGVDMGMYKSVYETVDSIGAESGYGERDEEGDLVEDYTVTVAGRDVELLKVISLIVTKYMSLNTVAIVPRELVQALLECVDDGSADVLNDIQEQFVPALTNDTLLMALVEAMTED